jgi:hypothetical protein
MNDIKAFIWRGALAGVLGGIAAALFQWAVTEDQIRVALEIEAANSSGRGDEMFSRGEQVFGGMLAAGLYGLCIGVVFGIACAALWHTLPGRSVFGRASRLAAVAFVAWVLVPALKYPANPPAVGDPDTVGERTVSYLGLMGVSILLAYLAWELWQRLGARGLEGAERFAAVAGAYLVAVTVAYLVFPANPDANGAPANLIWHFRLDSIGGNALLWLVLGTSFGWLGDRSGRGRAGEGASPDAIDRVSAGV